MLSGGGSYCGRGSYCLVSKGGLTLYGGGLFPYGFLAFLPLLEKLDLLLKQLQSPLYSAQSPLYSAQSPLYSACMNMSNPTGIADPNFS